MMQDTRLEVAFEIGHATMTLRTFMRLGRGAVMLLQPGDGADVALLVRGHRVARGEVLVHDGGIAVEVQPAPASARA